MKLPTPLLFAFAATISYLTLRTTEPTPPPPPYPECPPTTPPDLARPNLSSAPLHCFFSPSGYVEAREKFRKAVTSAGGTLSSRSLLNIPDDNDLTIDFGLFLPPSSSSPPKIENLLLHISGTHGVEGPAGSAIQLASLNYLASHPLSHPTTAVLFVHSLNAYGFKHHRRVNENNADLNRNFLTEEGWKEALARDPDEYGYKSLDGWLNQEAPPTTYYLVNEIVGWLRAMEPLITVGLGKIKKALVSGNYFDERGIGFGGMEKQQSVKILENYLLEHELNKPLNGVFLIDVHTGLGPSGIDTLMTADDISKYVKDDVPRLIESMTSSSSPGAASGYDATIGTTEMFCHQFFTLTNNHNNKQACICQEFGTVPSVLVGRALMEEMSVWRYNKDRKVRGGGTKEEKEFGEELKEIYSKKLLDVFYLRNRKWEHSVVLRGLTLFQDALETLSE